MVGAVARSPFDLEKREVFSFHPVKYGQRCFFKVSFLFPSVDVTLISICPCLCFFYAQNIDKVECTVLAVFGVDCDVSLHFVVALPGLGV